MAARRAILESEALENSNLTAFQHPSPRRAAIDAEALDDSLAVHAHRVIADPAISFEPEEPLSSTRPLPRITGPNRAVAPAARSSVGLRRGLLGVAAAATAGAALVMPSAMSAVTAQPAPVDSSTIDRAVAVSRSSDRTELVQPVTESSAQAIADAEAARAAEEERLAEEARMAEEERLAEAERLAEEERIAAEERAAQERAAEQARAAEAAAAATPAASSVASAGSSYTAAPSASPASTGVCAQGTGANLGLTYQAQAAFQDICARFPNVSSYGGWRASADDHGAGQAIDIMISGPAGWEIANYLVANAGRLNVEYVIYEQRIWGSWGGGWSYMEDRGSITQNHFDHVHVTVR